MKTEEIPDSCLTAVFIRVLKEGNSDDADHMQITEDTMINETPAKSTQKKPKPTRLQGTFEHRKQARISLKLYLPGIVTLKVMD